MTEEELARIRKHLKLAQDVRYNHVSLTGSEAEREAWHVLHDNWKGTFNRLLAAIDERDGIIHDLMQENAYCVGVEAERGRTRTTLQDLLARWQEWEQQAVTTHEQQLARFHIEVFVNLLGLQERKPARDPLPPDQARKEADRLRQALEEIRREVSSPLGGSTRIRQIADILERTLGDP